MHADYKAKLCRNNGFTAFGPGFSGLPEFALGVDVEDPDGEIGVSANRSRIGEIIKLRRKVLVNE